MKKAIKVLLVILSFCLLAVGLTAAAGAEEETAYAVFNSTQKTLTFVVGTMTDAGVERTADHEIYTGANYYTGFLTGQYNNSAAATRTPWYSRRTNITTVIFLDAIAPVFTAYWFNGFSNLTAITGIEKLNTSDVTDMSSMFLSCTKLTTLGLNGWNTENVTSMQQMFSGCSKLTELNLSEWNTGSVTTMQQMFNGCTSLASLNISAWNTGNVENMSGMFSGCSGLASLDLSSWDTGKVTNMSSMFSGCKLTSLSIVTSNVENMNSMFSNWASDSLPDLAFLKTDKATSMQSMFSNCRSITSLNLSGWNTGSVTIMQGMFNGCTALTSLNVGDWNTSSVTTMQLMFNGCSNLTELNVSGWDTGSVTTMQGMFNRCSALSKLTLGNFFTFGAGATLPSYDYWAKENDKNTLYTSAQLIEQYDGSSDMVGTWVRLGSFAVYNDTDQTISFMFGTPIGNNVLRAADGEIYVGTSCYSGFQTNNYTYSNIPWHSFQSNITEIIFLDPVTPISTANWFYGFSSLTTITGIEKLDTSNVTSMSNMFYNCTALTSLNLSSWDSGNVTDMSYMFFGCSALELLDISGWDTCNVTNMRNMFSGCSVLAKLTLGEHFSFGSNAALPAASNVFSTGYWIIKTQPDLRFTSTQLMNNYNGSSMAGTWEWEIIPLTYAIFNSTETTLTFVTGIRTPAGVIRTVDHETYSGDRYYNVPLTDGFPSWIDNRKITEILFLDEIAPQSTAYWFSGLSALVKITNIDNLNTSNVTEMYSMFSGCSALTSLDLSGFHTGSVTDMADIFEGCSSLISLNLNNWDTNNAQYMDEMFYGCSSLTSLNVSGWETGSVKTMSYMFEGCSSLVSLDLSNWDTQNVTSMTNIFSGCSYLSTLILGEHFLFKSDAGLPVYEYWQKEGGNDKHFSAEELMSGPNSETMAGTWVRHGTFAVYNDTDNSLTFVFGSLSSAGLVRDADKTIYPIKSFYTGFLTNSYSVSTNSNNVPWKDVSSSVTSVTFADRMAPVSTAFWLYEFNCLSSISGLENLDTSNVTNMNSMFYNCSTLQSLNLSSWDTENVTNLNSMFSGCSALTSLDLSSWNTENVISMSSMFSGCPRLVSLTLGEHWIFNPDITLPNFDSTDSYLYTDYWTKKDDLATLYTDAQLIAEYDGSPEMTGTWIRIGTYARFNEEENTLSFFVGAPTQDGIIRINNEVISNDENCYYGIARDYYYYNDPNDYSYAPWYSYRSDIKKVNFLDHILPTSTAYWFYGFTKLNSIDGIENLDTSQAVDMRSMFAHCCALKDLDVSGFNTEKATNLSCMFINCFSLTELNVSGFATSQVTDMDAVFAGCSAITFLDVSHFNTENMKIMDSMFKNCASITALDLSNFNTGSVTDMSSMFLGCDSLSHLTLGENFAFKENAQLPDAKNEFPYTGFWKKTGADDTQYTASQLMTNYNGSEMAGTWIWETTIRNIAEATVSGTAQTYTGKTLTTTVTVLWDDVPLIEGEDYEITGYENNTNAGTATIIVSGIGNYAGTSLGTFTILPKNIEDAIVTAEDQLYTGNEIEPPVTITLYGVTLAKDQDCIVEYSENVEEGIATITVTGIGNYDGKAFGSFEIIKEPEDDNPINPNNPSPTGRFSLLQWFIELFRKIAALFKNFFQR